jgi:PAS domain S-box-containing protein
MNQAQIHNWRILYIEDDEEDYFLVRHMLSKSHGSKINLSWAATYEEGLQKIACDQFDAILVDYDLGSNTGIELIRDCSKGYPAPLILYTGRGSHEVDLEAMNAGATMYLTKNEVNSLLLERAIRYAIEIKHKENELRLSREKLERELVERKLAEAALRESEAKLAAELRDTERLQRISSRLIQEEDVDTLYRHILDAAIAIMRSDMGSMQVYVPERNALRLIAWKGFAPASAEFWEWVQGDSDNICSTAVGKGQRLIVPDVNLWDLKNEPEIETHYRLSGIRSAQSTPLISRRGQLVGMISTHWRQPHHPSNRDLRLLDLLARQAADLLERKQAEENFRESEERFRHIVELSPDAIFVQTNEKIVFINPAGMRMFGAEYLDQIIGQNNLDLVPPDYKPAVKERIHLLNDKRERVSHFEEKLVRLNGEEFFGESTAVPIFYQGENGALVIIRDISERKRTEEALKESEKRFRTMADGTPLIIWVTDPAGNIEFINQAYTDFFGATLEQVQNEGWQPLVHPDTVDYIDLYLECLRDQRPFCAETRTLRKSGEWRWIISYAQPRFSESGDFLGMVGSSVDITEQKRTEENLQRYARELEFSNQALNDFTFFASHDLQEPLRKVKNFGHILKKRYYKELGDEGKDYVDRMTSAARRMEGMLKGLLEYSRVSSQGESFINVDLQKVIMEVISDLELRLQQYGGKVEFGPLPNIVGDRIQIRLLFQNLIGNGLKFQRAGLPPIVTITGQANGEKIVEIKIQDNGIGFDNDKAACLFEPFKRLHDKSEYEGSGMGLPICKKIVERHGGKITASSVPGQGSTFTVYLPASE